MKSEVVKIGKFLNEELWKHGIKNPPHKVKVTATKNDKGEVFAEKFGALDLKEKKEAKEKKSDKEAEPEKAAQPKNEAIKPEPIKAKETTEKKQPRKKAAKPQ